MGTVDNYLLAIVAIAQALTSYWAYRARNDAAETKKLANNTNESIRVVEHQTNSIKDALIVSTERSAMAEGRAEGLREGRAEERPGNG